MRDAGFGVARFGKIFEAELELVFSEMA